MEGLSTRGRYTVRILLYLAVRSTASPIRTYEIAVAEDIPQQYIEQLLAKLKVGGFVTSVRGAKGGYILACDPTVTTVADILAAVEGPVSLAPCDKDVCGRRLLCVTRDVWQKATDAMNDVFKSITLQSMVEQVNCPAPEVGNYSI
jgi:Rrf2 family protein